MGTLFRGKEFKLLSNQHMSTEKTFYCDEKKKAITE
jgi:hypothetical protein